MFDIPSTVTNISTSAFNSTVFAGMIRQAFTYNTSVHGDAPQWLDGAVFKTVE